MTLPEDCVGCSGAGVVGLGCGVNEILSKSITDAKYGFTLLCAVVDGDGEREGFLDGVVFAVSCASSGVGSADFFFFFFLDSLSLAALVGTTSSSSDSARPKALPM